jgi:hypothetical protein
MTLPLMLSIIAYRRSKDFLLLVKEAVNMTKLYMSLLKSTTLDIVAISAG